jgi:hypothetical protein
MAYLVRRGTVQRTRGVNQNAMVYGRAVVDRDFVDYVSSVEGLRPAISYSPMALLTVHFSAQVAMAASPEHIGRLKRSTRHSGVDGMQTNFHSERAESGPPS